MLLASERFFLKRKTVSFWRCGLIPGKPVLSWNDLILTVLKKWKLEKKSWDKGVDVRAVRVEFKMATLHANGFLRPNRWQPFYLQSFSNHIRRKTSSQFQKIENFSLFWPKNSLTQFFLGQATRNTRGDIRVCQTVISAARLKLTRH